MMKGYAGADWLAMCLGRWKRAAVALLLVWVLVSYLVMSPLRCPELEGSSDQAAAFQERLRAVSEQLEAMRAQHSALVSQIKRSKLSGNFPDLEGSLWDDGPSEAYETVRRRIYEHTKELWYYVSSELSRAIAEPNAAALQTLLTNVNHRKSSLLAAQQQLAAADGHAAWRSRAAARLSARVQARLRALQHPPDCARARKLVCNLNKGCGFGCQLHHVAYCLIFAYATERTLVLNSRGWRYHAKGWERVFHPLSDSCTSYDDLHQAHWPDMEQYWLEKNKRAAKPRFNELEEDILKPENDLLQNLEQEYWLMRNPLDRSLDIGNNDAEERILRPDGDLLKISQDVKVVSLPFIDSITQKPKFLPLAVPKDLAHSILRFNGDPASWWVGQMLVYILRPRDHVQKTINETIAKLDYKHPIVGMHIRRTDKVGTEAAFHHIHEYMKHAEQYWLTLELAQQPGEPAPRRRVYLASDDPNVLDDARSKYPDVEFVGDPTIARTAATHRRYTPASLHGLLVDLALLARADYLVCTFSSQVGRVAYELMQGNRADAAEAVFSLDDIYYFGGQNAHDRAALADHRPELPNEIQFRAGDLIGVAGNLWNGFGRGTNRRTNQNGLFPWYKTADHLVLYPFPRPRPLPHPLPARDQRPRANHT